ncbi:MAG TPA: hypothetical protein VFX05_08125 [Casimicrobiaceae bacterium]|nr:hypothetical protein [Casimicrobiaceae bacterium]
MSRPCHLVRTSWRRAVAAIGVAMLAGCAGAPPAGTPEYAAWVKDKQEVAASIEKAGCACGATWFRDLPAR